MNCRLAMSVLFVVCFTTVLMAQEKPKPEDTEVWKPEPPVVTPGPAVECLRHRMRLCCLMGRTWMSGWLWGRRSRAVDD